MDEHERDERSDSDLCDDDVLEGAVFDPAGRAAWRGLAESSLRGNSLSGLERETDEGIRLEPVYFREDRTSESDFPPGEAPFRRGAFVVPPPEGWDLRARVVHDELETLNHRALAELEGGANSLELRWGRAIDSAADLNRALEGVYLDLAPVALETGAHFTEAADALREVWNRREHDPALVEGAWNADPLRVALEGGLGEDPFPGSYERALEGAVRLAAEASAERPRVTALRVSTAPWHRAGCDDAQELAVAMATAIHYLRAMERAEVDFELAFEQILFELFLGADVFAGICKLRAARILWSRIAGACGVELRRGALVQGSASRRMISRREPMVNALRVTSAMTAAALGGATVATSLPYDARVGTHSERGRRLARTTQIVLREEAHLGHVLDPAGGSWYLEERTDRLAERGWDELQAIEGAGGIVEDVRSGRLVEEVASAAAARAERLGRHRPVLVGVSDFARLEDEPPPPEEEGEATAVLEPVPLDRDFEELRSASDRALLRDGRRPRVWLANLGSLAEYNARANFVRNLLAVGGLEAVAGGGAKDAEELVEDLRSAGEGPFAVAVICSTDEIVAERGAAAATALKEAGVGTVLVAGRGAEARESLEAAGVAGFVFAGMAVVDCLRDLHRRLGLVDGE